MTNKSIALIITSLLFTVALIGGYTVYLSSPSTAEAAGGQHTVELFDNNNNSGATTTSRSGVAQLPKALVSGAAMQTILTIDTQNADQVDLMLMAEASSTAATTIHKYQFSNNRIDWYDENVNSISLLTGTAPRIELSTTTPTYAWNAGTVSTSTKRLQVTGISSKYMRVQMQVAGAGASVYMQAGVKRGI